MLHTMQTSLVWQELQHKLEYSALSLALLVCSKDEKGRSSSDNVLLRLHTQALHMLRESAVCRIKGSANFGVYSVCEGPQRAAKVARADGHAGS